MELNYKSFGQGDPVIILHGLFGALDNWQTLAKRLADQFLVYIVDQRNHGRSPHTNSMSYPEMAEDLAAFMEANWMYQAHIIGHSMGGKTAMQFALSFPDMVKKLVVVDIAPRSYPPGHQPIFEALFAVDLQQIKDRKDAEKVLSAKIDDKGVRQFLLKNLNRTSDGRFHWKMNLPVIREFYDQILDDIGEEGVFEGPSLFLRGDRSDYVTEADHAGILAHFPNAHIESVENAGHWVHAEQPDLTFDRLFHFLSAS